MQTDRTTKFLLAAIAVGLFLNAAGAFIPAAWAASKVEIDSNAFRPVHVHCVKGCSNSDY